MIKLLFIFSAPISSPAIYRERPSTMPILPVSKEEIPPLSGSSTHPRAPPERPLKEPGKSIFFFSHISFHISFSSNYIIFSLISIILILFTFQLRTFSSLLGSSHPRAPPDRPLTEPGKTIFFFMNILPLSFFIFFLTSKILVYFF